MSSETIQSTSGAQMFARYAYAPNRLGYCGPPDSEALLNGTREQIEVMARQFSGAWPYLRVLARMARLDDPLDHALVESYWLGGGVGAELDRRAFTRELLDVIGPQAGHYWSHLTEELAEEAAPNHGFHVFGVYPWSRFLGRGMDEHPLGVLDHCRITWATVISVDGNDASVQSSQLNWDGTELSLSEPKTGRVELGLPAGTRLTEGDQVAVHWNRICDTLTSAQSEALERSTRRQLELTNRRLARQAP